MKPTIQDLLKRLASLQSLLASLRTKTIYQECLAVLNTDVTPQDRVPDDVACAETATTILRRVLPGFPIIPGTYTLWRHLENDKRFRRVTVPMPGTIIISPTGTAPANTKVRNGHVGFFGEGEQIMSNTSANGKFEQNYTLTTWKARWEKAGYPLFYYQLIR